jgi:hydrogenase nickel incorporation protein HypA/HybF
VHELSLAQSVVDLLLEEARRNSISRIEVARLRIGRLRAIVPDLLKTGLEMVGRGTLAEGARFEIEEVRGRARCPDCEVEFDLDDLFALCPTCGRYGCTILAGQELLVIEFEGE